MKTAIQQSPQIRWAAALALALFVCMAAAPSPADAPYCEVVNVKGHVQLLRKGQGPEEITQGTRLQQGDSLVVGPESAADLAFDSSWENTTRINADTRMNIRSLQPVKLGMMSGDIYSKLDNLKGSTFEIKTPTAVAAVRGTKFRTVHKNGFTTVYNDSEESLVYVYHLDENGNRAGRAITLKPGESITIAGEAEAYDSPLDELEEARDREDQDQLSEELSRERFEQPSEEPKDINNGNFGI